MLLPYQMTNGIAAAVCAKVDEYDYHDDFNHAPTALRELAKDVATELANIDRAFDRVAFLKACGLAP